MPIRRTGFPLLLLAASALGCISIGIGDDDRETERQVVFRGADFDAVWSATIQTFGDMRLPIASLEKESGLLTTDWILVDDPGEKMDCDENPRNPEVRFNIYVQRMNQGTEMTMTTSMRALREDGTTLQSCESTGAYEEEIRERVERRV
ncbi:hypothetical protein BH18GEM1_BH18GEM1_13730 [soil metagenome]